MLWEFAPEKTLRKLISLFDKTLWNRKPCSSLDDGALTEFELAASMIAVPIQLPAKAGVLLEQLPREEAAEPTVPMSIPPPPKIHSYSKDTKAMLDSMMRSISCA